MLILLIFAFISGLVTIFAPCIWPLLPIILSSTSTGGHKKPLGITLGITISFAFFTLTLSYIVKIIPFDPNILRLFAVMIIGFLGLVLIIPQLGAVLEGIVSKLSSRLNINSTKTSSGFYSGFILGLSLGIIWSPCAGPILATIATLAATQSVSFQTILVTIAYVAGIGIPLFIFATFGKFIFTKSKFLSGYTGRIQQIFGVIMILTAVSILTNFDKTLQLKLLNAFPSYSEYLYKLEGQSSITQQLSRLKGNSSSSISQQTEQTTDLPILGKAPDFVGINKWLNSDKPLSINDLKGKVVLVDFWTYTCINCIRTLPFVTNWYEKYQDKGFVVIGIHTPEFEFEKNTQNVEGAIKQYGIHYPVAQDNAYTTWNAYSNQYWPAEYLIDAQGNVRKTHFGEGEYDQTEMAIQKLLAEAGQQTSEALTQMPDQTPTQKLSPETYLGLNRLARFSSPETAIIGTKPYTSPKNLSLDHWAFTGNWDIQEEYATTQDNSSLEFNFSAGKVFLVITPGSQPAILNIYLDNNVVSNNGGQDVIDGRLTAKESRLYSLIDLKGNPGNHLLRIDFKTPGTKIYAFTFGS